MSASRSRVLFGTEEPVPEARALRAGALEVIVRGPRLVRIACGDVEIWHGAAFLFRDADWCTPEPIVDDFDESISTSGFKLHAVGRFPVSPPIDFRIDIEARDTGVIVVAAQATPRGDILASRLGLCVMHPISVAGAQVEIEHIDGRVSRTTFPRLIPPWPPFMLIRAIRHQYPPGRWARCSFDGDIFELEDQRNNGDASFKTYSRSNLMPRPYWLRAGVPIQQSVEFAIEMPRANTASRRPGAVKVQVGNDAGECPTIGVEISPDDAHAGEAARAALAAMRPGHLHLTIRPDTGEIDWRAIAELLAVAGAELRLDVARATLDKAVEEVGSLREKLYDAGVEPASVAVFPSEQRAIDAARRAFPGCKIGGGTPHFFVQLNRLDSLGRADFLTFTTSSIVHGADDESVMLTLQSLRSMIETLRARYPDVPIAIGPSGIAARASPLGAQPPTDGQHRIALAANDPRTRGLYGAAWTVGYVAQLATTGLDAVTVMSLTGAAGVVGTDGQGAFTRYPSYFVIERMRGPASVCSVTVSEPTRVAAFALRRGDGQELLIANLTAEALDVDVDDIARGTVAILDAETWHAYGSHPDVWHRARGAAQTSCLRLDAYAVASLQWP